MLFVADVKIVKLLKQFGGSGRGRGGIEGDTEAAFQLVQPTGSASGRLNHHQCYHQQITTNVTNSKSQKTKSPPMLPTANHQKLNHQLSAQNKRRAIVVIGKDLNAMILWSIRFLSYVFINVVFVDWMPAMDAC